MSLVERQALADGRVVVRVGDDRWLVACPDGRVALVEAGSAEPEPPDLRRRVGLAVGDLLERRRPRPAPWIVRLDQPGLALADRARTLEDEATRAGARPGRLLFVGPAVGATWDEAFALVHKARLLAARAETPSWVGLFTPEVPPVAVAARAGALCDRVCLDVSGSGGSPEAVVELLAPAPRAAAAESAELELRVDALASIDGMERLAMALVDLDPDRVGFEVGPTAGRSALLTLARGFAAATRALEPLGVETQLPGDGPPGERPRVSERACRGCVAAARCRATRSGRDAGHMDGICAFVRLVVVGSMLREAGATDEAEAWLRAPRWDEVAP